MKTIEVVAAVICNSLSKKSRLLAVARGYGEFKGLWEFPGGKIEDGEGPKKALKREIKEELDLEINLGDFIKRIDYSYPKFHLIMDCYWAEISSGSLKLKEHKEARWINKEELYSLDWLPADIELLEDIRRNLK